MTYRKNAKTRRLRAKLLKIINTFKFKIFVLKLPNQILTIWALISLISLFFPWVNSIWIDETFSDNAFSFRLWYIWYIIFILSFTMLILALSNNKKEQLKVNLSISFRDYNLVILSSFIMLLITFVSLNFIKWLWYYSKAISYWEWIIYCFMWWILAFVWGILLYREYKKELKLLYLENSSNSIEIFPEDKNNMKLPF